jgi:hypothetical protein
LLRIILIVAFYMHGLANLSGALAPWKQNSLGFSDSHWLLSTGGTLHSATGRLFSIAWLISSLCLIAGGAGLFLRQDWWLPLAIIGSLFSLIAIVPWWNVVPPGARFGAIFDAITLAILISPLGQQIAGMVD